MKSLQNWEKFRILSQGWVHSRCFLKYLLLDWLSPKSTSDRRGDPNWAPGSSCSDSPPPHSPICQAVATSTVENPFLAPPFSKDRKCGMTLGRWLRSSCADPMGKWRKESLIKSQRRGIFLSFSSPARSLDTPFFSSAPAQTKRGEGGGEQLRKSTLMAFLCWPSLQAPVFTTVKW